ncbi:MAG TPA: type VII secretion target [Candidatus Limnocylindrales bacterium]
MGDEVRAAAEGIRTHSRSLSGISDDVTTAHGAANQVYLDSGAFGKLCSFLPSLFDPVLRAAVDGISQSAANLSTTADKLKRAADGYDASDQQAATTVTAAGGRGINLPL